MDEKTMQRMEIGFGLVMLVTLIVFLVQSFQYPPRCRQLPMIVEVVGIALLGWHLISVVRAAVPSKKSKTAIDWHRIFTAFVSIVAYLVVAYFLGMIVASAVVVYGTSIAFGSTSKRMSLFVAVGTALFIWVAFTKLLYVPLWPGVIFY